MYVSVIIKPNQHVFIAGRTGSGKTYLVRKYLAGYENVVVLDTKGTTVWPEIPGTRWEERDNGPKPKGYLYEAGKEFTLVTRLKDLPMARTPKIMYRPVWEEMTPEFYDKFFKWCYQRRNTIVWVDEAMSVSPNPFKIPDYYKAILTRGRELNVAVWSLTQRPTGIAQVIISEATHIFCFDLNMPQDREKLAEISGAYEFEEPPGKYKFWYFFVESDRAVLAQLVERK